VAEAARSPAALFRAGAIAEERREFARRRGPFTRGCAVTSVNRTRPTGAAEAAEPSETIDALPVLPRLEDRVVDSRTSQEGRAVRRRRECLACGKRFTTYEYVEERQLLVAKRDGSSEPYDRHKVLKSMQLPCAKRPITGAEIELMVNAIEDELARLNVDEVPSDKIGELVMEQLRTRDYVAYVRYASVYRNFQDLDEFYEELKDLSDKQAGQR
jgi:transcriptional repressor NrdR